MHMATDFMWSREEHSDCAKTDNIQELFIHCSCLSG